MENSAEAVAAVTEVFIALDDALEAVPEPRLRAISEIYLTSRSYQSVTTATGLS